MSLPKLKNCPQGWVNKALHVVIKKGNNLGKIIWGDKWGDHHNKMIWLGDHLRTIWRKEEERQLASTRPVGFATGKKERRSFSSYFPVLCVSECVCLCVQGTEMAFHFLTSHPCQGSTSVWNSLGRTFYHFQVASLCIFNRRQRGESSHVGLVGDGDAAVDATHSGSLVAEIGGGRRGDAGMGQTQ